MSRRIPSDAFEQYVALGPDRSYQAVATKLGVTKRAISKCAQREGWSERLERVEQKAREKSDEKLGDFLAEMRERHLTTLKVIHTRAISALKQYPLTSGMEAIRAAELVIKLERLVAGEPTERQALDVEAVTRRELDRWASLGGENDVEEE